ncbi:MAG: FAD-dependent monooxygenase, partial [Cyanobacteria bacterium J06600_6]
ASRQKAQTLSCTLFIPSSSKSLDKFQNGSEVLDFLQVNFPTIASSISLAEAEDFLQSKLAKIWTVSCNRYHYRDRALIIGDAAHAISPSIGQGCNSALEDVMVLDDLLDKYNDNWQEVLPQYSQSRIVDAHAVRELADHALPLTKGMFILFMIKLTINRTLHRIFPQTFPLPFFDLIPDTTIAYSEIYRSAKNWITLVKKSNERYLKRV